MGKREVSTCSEEPMAASSEDQQSWALLLRRLQWHAGFQLTLQPLVAESQEAMG